MSEDQTNAQFETGNLEIVSQGEGKEVNSEASGEVKYATHKKLLNQLKNKSSELEELKRWKSEIEENDARKKGDYEKLLQSKDSQLKEYQEKLSSYERNMIEGQKLQAVVNKLPGKVKKNDYLSFVDLDEIALDPDTGKVDEHSLGVVVNKFIEEHSSLIETKTDKKLPKVGSFGGRPNLKRSLKDLSREELKMAYLRGEFKE